MSFNYIKPYGSFLITDNEVSRLATTAWCLMLLSTLKNITSSLRLFLHFVPRSGKEALPNFVFFVVSMATWGILHWHNETQLTWWRGWLVKPLNSMQNHESPYVSSPPFSCQRNPMWMPDQVQPQHWVTCVWLVHRDEKTRCAKSWQCVCEKGKKGTEKM